VSTTTSKTNKRRQIPLELIHDRIITGSGDELISLTPISSSNSLSKALKAVSPFSRPHPGRSQVSSGSLSSIILPSVFLMSAFTETL